MTDIVEVKVRKRRSTQEIRRLVTEFEAGGLRQVEFCKTPWFSAEHIATWAEKAPEGSGRAR